MQTIAPKHPDTAHLSDTELVALANSGSSQAFRTIMQRFNQLLYRVARGILHDEAEAEDVLQDAYVRAFAALRKFRRESSLGTWLTRIVMNEAVSRLGQRRPSDELETLDRVVERGDARVIMFPGVLASADPEAVAAQAQVRRLLEDAIDELPEAFRLVFVMRDVEELSIQETAAMLAIRPETAKTRLHRARRLVRKNLDSRLSDVLRDIFPFQGARCARISDAVAARLGLDAGADGNPC